MSELSDVNYGPLTGLVGNWSGNKGKDVSPEPDGSELNDFYETITFTQAGELSNAESQQLSAVHYQLMVKRISNDKIIHQETGYWMWEQDSNSVMHSLVIPRGVCVLAGGSYTDENEQITFNVQAMLEDENWQLIQSPFMAQNAKMESYDQQVILSGDKLFYKQTMALDIYGRKFDHTDQNTLTRQWS